MKNDTIFVDKTILFSILSLLIFGLYIQFNLGVSVVEGGRMMTFIKHIAFISIGISLCAMLIIKKDLSKHIFSYASLYAIITIALLAIVIIVGSADSKGGIRRLNIGRFTFQPSALAHPVLIILFAKHLARFKDKLSDFDIVKLGKTFFPLIIITGLMMVLIFLGVHFSTIVVLCCTLICMLFLANIKKSIILTLILAGMLTFYGITVLKNKTSATVDHREGRLKTFQKYSLIHKALGIDKKVVGNDYQVWESLTAISKGGFWGVGRYDGMAKNYYLPEISTDFVFAIIAEERGFIGGLLVIVLYTIFFFRSITVGLASMSYQNQLLILGLSLNIFITALVNIGVAIATLPNTGLPLPFISAGGSAMLVNFIMIGIILNLTANRNGYHGN
jgi:cell division protein FtsW